MKKDKKGNLIFSAFRRDGRREFYIFTRENYEIHSRKHCIIGKKALQHIENALQKPDCITIGPKEKQKNYYLVVNSQKSKKSIAVEVYKIICYKKRERGKQIYYKIATTINWWGPNYQVVHYLEKTLWKKISSLI